MITPRPYLSWSSMSLFENNIEAWKKVYIHGEKTWDNNGMKFGRQMAEGLEDDKFTGDAVLDLVIEQIPKFEIMDKAVEAVLKNGKNPVPLLAKPDTMKADFTAFKEYKTGQEPWSRKKVDTWGQIDFYAVVLFIKSGKIPSDIELVHIPTRKIDKGDPRSKLEATGEIIRHKTIRNMSQILNMMVRMKRAWEGIQKVTAEEML